MASEGPKKVISADLKSIISRALKTGVEVSLNELMGGTLNDPSALLLDQISQVTRILDEWELVLIPDLGEGDLETQRILRHSFESDFSAADALREIKKGESSQLEFKSSLFYDHNRALADPNCTRAQLKSERVTFSILKTIAAFLNSGGGTLYVGISDSGQCLGIEYDYGVLHRKHADQDGWQLELRDHIKSKFYIGETINDYVQISYVTIEERTAARVLVQSRHKLSFLKKDGRYRIFRRQGNRTLEAQVEQIEEFLDYRKQNGIC